MTQLNELAARVEQADGPSRELDLAIWRIVDPKAPEVEAEGKVPLPWLHCYTSSLNAAMTLVPEGWHGAHLTIGASGSGSARCWNKQGTPFTANAATPALALCAAALKALSQQENKP